MPKRDTNPGGSIGEAMRDAKRVRKPRPLMIAGQRAAYLSVWGNATVIYTQSRYWTPAQARRLSAWLTRAAAWIEQEERDGR